MLSDSLGKFIGIGQGSVENVGGSIGTFLGNGIGSLSDNLTPILDALATGSRQGDAGGK